jgi:hypothetical protein
LKAANFDDLYIETETVRLSYLNNEKLSGLELKKKTIQVSPDITRVNDGVFSSPRSNQELSYFKNAAAYFPAHLEI